MDCVFKTLSYLTSMKKHLAKIFKGETPRCKQFLQKSSIIHVWQCPNYTSESYSSKKYSLGRGLSEVKDSVLEAISMKNKNSATAIKL